MEINTTKYKNCKEFVQTKLLNQYDFANLFNVVKLGEKSYFNICSSSLKETNSLLLIIINNYSN